MRYGFEKDQLKHHPPQKVPGGSEHQKVQSSADLLGHVLVLNVSTIDAIFGKVVSTGRREKVHRYLVTLTTQRPKGFP